MGFINVKLFIFYIIYFVCGVFFYYYAYYLLRVRELQYFMVLDDFTFYYRPYTFSNIYFGFYNIYFCHNLASNLINY